MHSFQAKRKFDVFTLMFANSLLFQSVKDVFLRDYEGANMIEQLTSGLLSGKCRRKMVQLLVSELIDVYGDK